VEMTLKLKTMAMVWRDVLMNSQKIKDFCQQKYEKVPTIFMGVNGRDLPDKKYCPAIFILPGIKTEGADQDVLSYGICVSWSICQPKAIVDGVEKAEAVRITGNVIEMLGMYECDDFGQLIYDELQAALLEIGFPITKVEYNIDTQAFYPQFPGYMVLTTEIEPAMGEEIEYKE